MATEITIAQMMDRLVAISRANAKNAETILRLAEVLRDHISELENEVEELRRRDAGSVKKR